MKSFFNVGNTSSFLQKKVEGWIEVYIFAMMTFCSTKVCLVLLIVVKGINVRWAYSYSKQCIVDDLAFIVGMVIEWWHRSSQVIFLDYEPLILE